ncbi:DUF922 domain-containing protein [Leptobacterium flavescens]|uniref:DUF922 domain-containing protein n=1 Tax=Leptobacterium flavescens TaxID=472055 RepID=A0A6P0UG38_9FLAO|nr:DUF922 domain-containing protein [Leptobacterium flavescens]NER12241.1 DUF922 domain-containing protein [Leptobacterium flavescens]
MQKWSIILVFLLLLGSKEEEFIEWSEDRKLTWADFKGDPDYDTDAAATTASGISYKLSAGITGDKVNLKCEVKTYFYPQSSWYKKELSDSIVLSHEQLHFDITELHARKLRKRIEEGSFTADVKAEVRAIYAEVNDALRLKQRAYDNATDFSRDHPKQREWGILIKKELSEFENYQ